MIAQEGKTYAQVMHGVCHWIFTKVELPEWNEHDIFVVDITGKSVAAGDLWDGEKFTSPPAPPPPPVENPVPFSVTRFQALAALHGAGLLSQVETYMADANTPVLHKLAWNNATEFDRASPTVAALQTLLGKSSDEIDALFIAARAIRA